jgi:hypothetical protein
MDLEPMRCVSQPFLTSEGLEFDTVVMLAIERRRFRGRPDEERSASFVGIFPCEGAPFAHLGSATGTAAGVSALPG